MGMDMLSAINRKGSTIQELLVICGCTKDEVRMVQLKIPCQGQCCSDSRVSEHAWSILR